MRKLIGVILVLAMICLMLAGCGSGGNGKSNDDEKTIAIVPWSMAETFAVDFSHAATEAIEAKGWKAVTMDPKGNWAEEYTIIQNLITQGIDGIIYTAIDADGANDVIAEVKKAGIPIVGYDCLSSAGTEDAAVRYDDAKGGELAAQECMKALNNKADAKIVVFEDDPSISSSTLRVNAFCKYIEDNFPNATVILNRSQDKTADGCYIWATDMITAYPDADAFFCYWNECTMATYNALQDAGKKDVFVIGYDATSEQQELMKRVGVDCRLVASPGMSPTNMAIQCVESLDSIMKGEYTRQGPDDFCELTPVLLTAANAQEFDINAK